VIENERVKRESDTFQSFSDSFTADSLQCQGCLFSSYIKLVVKKYTDQYMSEWNFGFCLFFLKALSVLKINPVKPQVIFIWLSRHLFMN